MCPTESTKTVNINKKYNETKSTHGGLGIKHFQKWMNFPMSLYIMFRRQTTRLETRRQYSV
jgi:hypothetical protein